MNDNSINLRSIASLPPSPTTHLMSPNDNQQQLDSKQIDHKWLNRYDSKSRHALTKEDLKDIALSKWMFALATKRIARCIRQKHNNRIQLVPLKKTFANLNFPKPIAKFDGARMYLCDKCSLPCPAADVKCRYCNIVCHVDCFTQEERKTLTLEFDSNPEDDNNFYFTCCFCSEDTSKDETWFQNERKQLYIKETELENAKLIGRLLRGFVDRTRYQKYLRACKKIQAMFRHFIEARKFRNYRRNMMRPLLVSVLRCNDLTLIGAGNHNGSTTNKDINNTRNKKLNPKKRKEASHKHTAGHANQNRTKQDEADENIEILNSIYVIATLYNSHREQTIRFDTSKSLVDSSSSANVGWRKQDFLVHGVNGSAEITFTVVECNFEGKDIVLGQTQLQLSKDDIWLTGGSFTFDLHSEIKHVIWDNRAQEAQLDYDKLKTVGGSITVEITELWSKHSVCGPVEGPHIDVLVSLGEKTSGQTQNISKMAQKMSYWSVITNNALLIYKHFGDPVPRVCCNLSKMQVSRGKLTGRAGKDVTGGPRRGSVTGGLGLAGAGRRTAMNDTRRFREFVLCSEDGSSRNKQKYIFETHSIKTCNLFLEMLEYWINK